jgi:catalase
MLEARLFSYPDTHRHRLGVSCQLIPVNMPVNAKVNNYQRDRSMMVHANGGGAPNYFPHSFLGPTPRADGIWHSDSVSGDVLISFPTVSSARRLVLMASGIVILCGR